MTSSSRNSATSSGGRRAGDGDFIDHAPGAHDDVANAVAGALLRAQADVGSLARLADFLIEGEPALHPEAPKFCFAVLVRGERGEHLGRGVAIIAAYEPALASHIRIVLVDIVVVTLWP